MCSQETKITLIYMYIIFSMQQSMMIDKMLLGHNFVGKMDKCEKKKKYKSSNSIGKTYPVIFMSNMNTKLLWY